MAKPEGNRATVYIDPDLDQILDMWAAKLKTTRSSLINMFIAQGLIGLEEEESDPYSRLQETRSIRYKYVINISDFKERLRELLDDD